MYAIGLEHDGDLGLIGEPFESLKECMEFIKKHKINELADDVYILSERYIYGPPLIEYYTRELKKD